MTEITEFQGKHDTILFNVCTLLVSVRKAPMKPRKAFCLLRVSRSWNEKKITSLASWSPGYGPGGCALFAMRESTRTSFIFRHLLQMIQYWLYMQYQPRDFPRALNLRSFSPLMKYTQRLNGRTHVWGNDRISLQRGQEEWLPQIGW